MFYDPGPRVVFAAAVCKTENRSAAQPPPVRPASSEPFTHNSDLDDIPGPN
ncbi:hypothetical protein CGLO_07258 [Colletotrichum gloeosporioides Cg-14]|uniref:Uncharacterized protein n=1 Tax=Colletotrichum gloeosporioides (strain Cg-14) TaxID=1237896 RepID=T0KJW8_COLGC|nr:hypothetical protein CGLO_07258 [Colletotrichum gloeosporioides Cg-14]